MTIGNKIKKYRILRGLTQEQLGAMVNLTGDRIRQYENDVRKPKKELRIKIAEVLKVNPIVLFEPDYDNPNSVMHTLFELEDIYGLHFEEMGDSYELFFSNDENHKNSNLIMNGIALWTNKRKEFQPDINDSAETIVEKRKKYTQWKACYYSNIN